MLSKMKSKCGVSQRTELYELVSMMNKNKNPRQGRPTGLRRGGKMA